MDTLALPNMQDAAMCVDAAVLSVKQQEAASTGMDIANIGALPGSHRQPHFRYKWEAQTLSTISEAQQWLADGSRWTT